MSEVVQAVDSEDHDKSKEVLALTIMPSDQLEPHVTKGSHGNLISSYHNIAFLKVPIAEAESDCETTENEDDDEVEDEQQMSQVNLQVKSKVKLPGNLG